MLTVRHYVMENSRTGFDSLSDGIHNASNEFIDYVRDDIDLLHAYALKRRVRPLGDWIASTGGLLMLSERATELFRRFSVCDSVRWVPLTIHDRQEAPLLTGTILYLPKHWDVLDLIRSEYEFYENTEVISKVNKWVLREEGIPPFDAFYTRELRWVASARLHDAIIDARLTGFRFLPTKGELG